MKGKILGLFLMCLLFASCGKDNNVLPDVPVNFISPLTDPRLSRLTAIGGAVTISNHGIAGLIIYRRPDNTYVAFDRCSTVNPEKKNAVVLDDPTLTATDPVSGAKFSLFDGSPVKAPAKIGLRQYNVTLTGNNNTIQVTN